MNRIWTLFLCAMVATACDSKSESTDSVTETVATAEEPAPEPIKLGSDAFEGVTPLDHLPAGADLAVVTANSGELAKLIALEPTAEGEGLGACIPALSDLHPDSLTKLGFDPNEPVGLVRYAGYGSGGSDLKETGRWAFIAKIGDRDTLIEALGEPQALTFPEPKDAAEVPIPEGILRQVSSSSRKSPPEVWETDGWAVVAPKRFRFAASRDTSLAAADAFAERRNTLQYGELATIWMKLPQSEAVALGLAMEDGKIGLRAVSTTKEAAAQTIDEMPAHIGSTMLAVGRVSAILGALGSSTEVRVLEKEIEWARTAPRLRQIETATAAVKERASEPVESDDAHSELLPTDHLARLHDAWVDAAMTDEESKAIAKMEEKLEAAQKEAAANIFGELGSMKDQKNIFGDIKGIDLGGNGLIGSDDGLGGGGGTAANIFGELALRKVNVSSADSAIKPYVSRKVIRVKRCFGSAAPKPPFDVTARMSTDSDGKVSVSSVTGGDPDVQSCVERALGGMASEKDVSGSVTFSFVKE